METPGVAGMEDDRAKRLERIRDAARSREAERACEYDYAWEDARAKVFKGIQRFEWLKRSWEAECAEYKLTGCIKLVRE